MTLLEALGFLGPANDFNVFVLNEMTAGNTDATGRLAVGGTATFNNYAVANGQHGGVNYQGDNAIFGGDLVLQGNLNMNSGSVVVGGTVSGTGTINFNSNQGSPAGSLKQGEPIDFTTAATDLQGIASRISSWPQSEGASAKVVNGNELVIASSTPGLVVVNVRIEDLNNPNSQVRFDVPANSTVIVNVVGAGTVNWPQWNYFLPGTMTGSNILWNMPEVTEMSSQYAGIKGSVLAPNATFNFLNGHIDGQLIVNNLYGAGGATSGGQLGESHYFPFQAPEETPDPTVVPTEEPTETPTEVPTEEPTETPTEVPTEEPIATPDPTEEPVVTPDPTEEPTVVPTKEPTEEPVVTPDPTEGPTEEATPDPTQTPTEVSTETPTEVPTEDPVVTPDPTEEATPNPTEEPVVTPDPTEEPIVTPEPTEETVLTPDPTDNSPTLEPAAPLATPVMSDNQETPLVPQQANPAVSALPSTGNDPERGSIGDAVAIVVGLTGITMLIAGEIVRRQGASRRES